MEKPKIFLGFPVYNRMVDMEIMSMVFHIASLQKYQMMLEIMCGPYIDSNRNKMVEDFLKTDLEWLYFWDTDVVIQDPDFFDKLLETSEKMDAPVVAIPYVKKTDNDEYVTLKLNPNGSMPNYKIGELDEPQIIIATGAGALLIHRDVLEEMTPPYFEINPSKEGGREMPEDYYFCLKVRDLGYKIALDTRIDTYHYGPASWVHKYKSNQSKFKRNGQEKGSSQEICEEGCKKEEKIKKRFTKAK